MKKTIKAKLDTSSEEQQLLDVLWKNWNAAIRDEDAELYSATKQQISQKDVESPGHPVVLRNDVFTINRTGNTWYAKIPHKDVYGGLKVPVHVPHRYDELLERADMRDSQLRPEKGDWYIHIVVEFDTPETASGSPDVVIGVDLGEHHLATSVALVNGEIQTPEYHDNGESRRIRSHYHRLRRKLQDQNAYRALQRISGKQKRAIDNLCHKISRRIVDKAERYQQKGYTVAIAVGDLEGIREQDWGNKGNRKLHSFPFYKLTRYIKYKAKEQGIRCELVDESYTSQTCNRCGQRGRRPKQGRFVCTHEDCEVAEYNADMNAAINIGSKLSRKLRRPLWEQQGGIGDAPKPALVTPQPG